MLSTVQIRQVPLVSYRPGGNSQMAAWRPAYAARPGLAAPLARVSPKMGQADVVIPIIAVAGTLFLGGFAAYHGYKRNRGSIGWGAWWGLLGVLFPPFTQIVALAQGYGYRVPQKKSPKKKK